MPKNKQYSFDDLKSFIYNKICKDHNLLYETSATSEKLLRRRSAVCGIMFHLRGPRKTLFTAVYDIEQNRAFFYGTNGARYREINGIELESHPDSLTTRGTATCE